MDMATDILSQSEVDGEQRRTVPARHQARRTRHWDLVSSLDGAERALESGQVENDGIQSQHQGTAR